jgi:hypothetical protein
MPNSFGPGIRRSILDQPFNRRTALLSTRLPTMIWAQVWSLLKELRQRAMPMVSESPMLTGPRCLWALAPSRLFPPPWSARDYRVSCWLAVLFWPWRAAFVSSSPERLDPHRSPPPRLEIWGVIGIFLCPPVVGKPAWWAERRLFIAPATSVVTKTSLTWYLTFTSQGRCWWQRRRKAA